MPPLIPIDELLREGFCAIISREVPLDDFVSALVDVVTARRPEDVLVVGGRPKRRTRGGFERVVDLTRREREVLELLVEGASGNEIAEELRISINTVRSAHPIALREAPRALAVGSRGPRRTGRTRGSEHAPLTLPVRHARSPHRRPPRWRGQGFGPDDDAGRRTSVRREEAGEGGERFLRPQ